MTRLFRIKDIRVLRAIAALLLFLPALLFAADINSPCPPGIALDEFCPPVLYSPDNAAAYNHYDILFSWSHI